eukprot:545232_1
MLIFELISLFIISLINDIKAQECDCFEISLNDIYEYRPTSGIFCYEYYIDQDTTSPACFSSTELTVTFYINDNDCYLNDLELADVMIDTNPNVWSFTPATDFNPPGVTFNIPVARRSFIEMCIDGTHAFLTQSLVTMQIDQNVDCEQIFTSNPDFCESYQCDVNPTCYCFEERELCENAPAEFGKVCLWDEDEQRCDAQEETLSPTPSTTVISTTPAPETTYILIQKKTKSPKDYQQ